MVQRQFGQYGHVVILIGADAPHRPVPFGVFDTHDEAEKWAESELTLHDGDTYHINYVRDVVPSNESGPAASIQRLAHDVRDLLDDENTFGGMTVHEIRCDLGAKSHKEVSQAVSYGVSQGFLVLDDRFRVWSKGDVEFEQRYDGLKARYDELIAQMDAIEPHLPHGF